jgi:uncharacterized membrane protein YczE
VLTRFPRLLLGLVLVGVGVAFMARSGLGLGSWSVLHEGISVQSGLALGTADLLVSIPVLLAWFPLRQLPGVGTVAAGLLVGPITNLALEVMAVPKWMGVRIALLIGGSIFIGLGTSVYLAVNLGPGPRDGLMTGINRRFGWSIRRVRTVLELSVLLAGFLLGGTVGAGTVIHAFAVGPIIQMSLRWLDRDGVIIKRQPSTDPSRELS